MNETFVALISSVTTAMIAWLIGRRKSKAEAVSVELKNVQEAIQIWRKTAEELDTRCRRLMTDIEDLRVENNTLKNEMKQLTKQFEKSLNNKQ